MCQILIIQISYTVRNIKTKTITQTYPQQNDMQHNYCNRQQIIQNYKTYKGKHIPENSNT